MKNIFLATCCLVLTTISSASAQVSSDFGGAVVVGASTTTCDGTVEGAIRYNSTTPAIEFCDGSSWTDTNSGGGGGGGGCNVFSGFSFTNTAAGLSTVKASNITQIDTQACSASVTLSGDGSGEFRICDNSDCSTVDHTWGSSTQNIDDGQYLQLRATSSGSYATTVTVYAVIGGAAIDQFDLSTLADPTGAKYVFVSSATYNADLETAGSGANGYEGADNLCDNLASASALPAGTYMAWLSTKDSDPATRFTQHTGTYQTFSGIKVADNWTDLVDGTLDNPINEDEEGTTVSAENVWTATETDGTANTIPFPSTQTICSEFTSSGGSGSSSNYNKGNTSYTDSKWAEDSAAGTGYNCADTLRLFCFEQ